ncbi:hypothetical protein DF185_02495 [Marinifilum breve]|uniref:ATP-grasp domain-containing protein n=1 Tax=Marinifilum breve TaxID=2184082 RepID=A0A2V4A2V7_9BACT|nr:NAD-dependent epimerase/dehydratase family protein [Marinifilum breve]PXY02982.1 hypothetical protein DF185_02495 [Marinifilum breve]
MATVLVTCAGSGVGQSVLDSLNLTGRDLIIGCDMNENVFAFDYCHKFHITPGIYSENYLEFILNISKQEGVDIIIPGHDHELLLFAQNINLFKENKIEVLVASNSPDIIEISRDKYKWYDYFKEYGCSIVPTYLVTDFKKNPDPSIFPAIVKPSGGSASQGIEIIKKPDELSRAKDEDIIQPYLFPLENDSNYKTILNAVEAGRFVQMSEISVQIVFSKNSDIESVFISKNTLKNGVPVFVDTIDPDDFEYIDEINKFAEVLKSKKVIGPVNLQGRITNRGFLFFEMNMRFTGITGNRAKLGFNEVDYLVKDFLGDKSRLENKAFNKVGIRQVACLTKYRTNSELHSKKIITVLGGSGFIGSYFVNEIIKSGEYKEINLICRDSSFEKYLQMYNGNNCVSIIKESSPELESRYCQSDILVNFSSARANESEENMFKSIYFQYSQSQKIAKAGIPFIINISSQSVYDQKLDAVKKEKNSLSINNLYAFQKFIGEEFFKDLHKNYPYTRVLSLRFTRVVGVPHTEQKPDGFFAKIIENILGGESVNITNPMNKINLLDIRDAVDAIRYFISYDHKDLLDPVINVGGTNLSMKEYCDSVLNSLNLNNKKHLIYLGDSQEVKVSSMVNTDLAESYSWKANYTVEDTIRNMYSVINKEKLSEVK